MAYTSVNISIESSEINPCIYGELMLHYTQILCHFIYEQPNIPVSMKEPRTQLSKTPRKTQIQLLLFSNAPG